MREFCRSKERPVWRGDSTRTTFRAGGERHALLIAPTKPDGSPRYRAVDFLRDVEPFTLVEFWAWRALTTRSALANGSKSAMEAPKRRLLKKLRASYTTVES